MRNFCLFFSSLICQILIGQDLPVYSYSSPEASALMRYSEIPVSHATGVPEISIPFFSLKEGDITVPISISYHASGILATDIASTVGLGWVLNAGGMVVKNILGIEDTKISTNNTSLYNTKEELNLAIQSAITLGQKYNVIDQLNNLNKAYFETTSDTYNYNFGGYSGSFIEDFDGEFRLIPYQPFLIQKVDVNGYVNNDPSQNYYLKITDHNGVKYYFLKYEYSTQASKIISKGYVLTKIQSNDSSNEINFHYSSGQENIVSYDQISKLEEGIHYTYSAGNLPLSSRVITINESLVGTQQTPKRLDSIVSSNSVVKFDYAADRIDGRKFRLKKIRLLKNNEEIKFLTLNHTYFGNQNDHTARLRLDNVEIGGKQMISIENYGFKYNNTNYPGYYYPLPSNTIIREDYWGYCGGQGGIPREFLSFLSESEKLTYGGNKNPTVTGAHSFILKEIQYPTSGKTVFEYENNRTDNNYFYSYPNNNHGGIVGGVRIKKITNYLNETNISSFKTYTYENVGLEQRITSDLFTYNQEYYYFNSNGISLEYPVASSVKNVFSSSSVVPLSILGKSPVIYDKVTETYGDSENNVGKIEYVYWINPKALVQNTSIETQPKYISTNQRYWANPSPKLISETYYKSVNNDFQILSKKINFYKLLDEGEFNTGIHINQKVRFIDIYPQPIPEDDPGDHVYNYLYSFEFDNTKGYEYREVLDYTVDSIFHPSGNLQKTTSYKYDDLDLMLPTQEIITYGDEKYKTVYTYTRSDGDPVEQEMFENHLLSNIIEKKTYFLKNSDPDLLLSSEINKYKKWNLNPNQFYIEEISIKKGLEQNSDGLIQFKHYSEDGNPLEVKKSNGPSISYLWGYQGEYPVAKIENATRAEVLGTGVNELVLNSSTSTSQAKEVELNKVRNGLPNAMVTTYEYEPLVGITKITDPRGQEMTYEYDDFNRLKAVLDDDMKLLQEYRYHYKGQN